MRKGLFAILQVGAFAVIMNFMIRWGGAWQTTARVMIGVLGGWLGIEGVYRLLQVTKKEIHRCYSCGAKATRYCDFQMASAGSHDDNSCGRWACDCHLHLSDDGKRDLCHEHYNCHRERTAP